MKKPLISLLFSILTISAFSQSTGNVIYQNQINLPYNSVAQGRQTANSFDSPSLPAFNPNELVLNIKGLNNVKADAYVALFNVSQEGKTAQEVNELMDARIDKVKQAIASYPNITMHVDMVTSIPMYEFEEEKKVFSKNTYNEVPTGFKLKKNLHIQFEDADLINKLVRACSGAEIYDLVKVDYISANMEAEKMKLIEKAQTMLKAKMKRYEFMMDISMDTLRKRLNEGFRVVYPVEMYQSCQAYSSSAISNRKVQSQNVTVAQKATTQYYQPIAAKSSDFVLNPMVVEPVIQIVYEVNLHIQLKNPQPQRIIEEKTKVMILTPDGNVRPLDVR